MRLLGLPTLSTNRIPNFRLADLILIIAGLVAILLGWIKVGVGLIIFGLIGGLFWIF